MMTIAHSLTTVEREFIMDDKSVQKLEGLVERSSMSGLFASLPQVGAVMKNEHAKIDSDGAKQSEAAEVTK